MRKRVYVEVESIKNYWRRVYEARFFWLHLSKMDLKNKFRRSKLGILWVCVNPFCLMMIMSVVFGTVFHQEMRTYAPYVLSVLLFWNVVTEGLITGASVIIGCDPYIRQFNHPVIIYPIKATITSLSCFVISTLALGVLEIFISPVNVLIGYISLPLTLLIYFGFGLSCCIIASFIGTKYRDYPQIISLTLQAVWYLSPVFFQESMFMGNKYLYLVFIMNPLTHLLKLLRCPFLDGTMPSLVNYAVSIGTVAFLGLIAYIINKRCSKDIIFYI